MSSKNEQGGMDVKQKNVYSKPLHQHSHPNSAPKDLPPIIATGFCNSTNPIAATLTNAFLDFSASRGTDLRKSYNISPGARFCVDVGTWKDLAKRGQDVPRVKLECTHESALKDVDLGLLEQWRAEMDSEKNQDLGTGVRHPKDNPSQGLVRHSQEIGGKEPKA